MSVAQLVLLAGSSGVSGWRAGVLARILWANVGTLVITIGLWGFLIIILVLFPQNPIEQLLRPLSYSPGTGPLVS